MMPVESLTHERTRAGSYKLLSECYYSPDEKLLKKLKNLGKTTGWPCCEIAQFIPKNNPLSMLTVEFSKLFLGPFKLLAPPFGSVYLDTSGTVMSNSTTDVRDRYRQEGVDIALKEVPDHVAIELEFMYLLVFKQVEALNNSDNERIDNYVSKQISFLQMHLGKWISEFANNIETHAKTDFYKNLARLTKEFLEQDLENLLTKVPS